MAQLGGSLAGNESSEVSSTTCSSLFRSSLFVGVGVTMFSSDFQSKGAGRGRESLVSRNPPRELPYYPPGGSPVAAHFDLLALRQRLLGLARRLEFLGPTLARLTVGLVFVSTGWGKLHGLGDLTEYFTGLHIPAPAFQARLVAATEFCGGLAMLLGLGTRLFALPLSVTMVVAISTAKRDKIDGLVTLVGFEEWSYLVFFLWIVLAGAGPLSLDYLLARRLSKKIPLE
jgi:putative oxidoreductase